MTHMNRVRRPAVAAADHQTLLEIADVLDTLCTVRAELDPRTTDHTPVRVALFELLDRPTQAAWERTRGLDVVPSFLDGLATPSPLGMTLGDIVYSFGLTDVVCPSRKSLLRALRWVAGERGAPAQG